MLKHHKDIHNKTGHKNSKAIDVTLVKLSQLQKGERAVIDSFTDDQTKQKLLEMGCLPGEIVQLMQHAPLGCPIAIKVSDYVLSLRIEEAETVIVEPIS